MIVGLGHAGCTVANLEQELRFYHDVLGIEHITSQVSDQPYLAQVTGHRGCRLLIGFAKIADDPNRLELIEYLEPKGVPVGNAFGRVGTLHVCWSVDNLDEVCASLNRCRVSILSGPLPFSDGPWRGLRGLLLQDSDGLLVELIEDEGCLGSGRLVRIHHTGMIVSRLEPAVQFFRDLLGLQVLSTFNGASDYVACAGGLARPDVHLAYLSIPGSNYMIEVCELETPAGPAVDTRTNNPGSEHICFLTADIMGDYERLRARGIKFPGPPAIVTAGVNQGAYAIYFNGPDHIAFELFQGPKQQERNSQ